MVIVAIFSWLLFVVLWLLAVIAGLLLVWDLFALCSLCVAPTLYNTHFSLKRVFLITTLSALFLALIGGIIRMLK